MDKVEKLLKLKAKKNDESQSNNIQHNLGKYTAKERILKLLDEGSFIEIGGLVSKDGAGVLTGYGTVNGRLVYVSSQDYALNGGVISNTSCSKILNIMNMASKVGAPVIQILDSAGAVVSQGLNILKNYGKIIRKNAELSGVIPQISLILGPCEGISALTAAMSDFTIITKNNGVLCVNPSEKLTEEEATFVDEKDYAVGSKCVKNGNVQLLADDEDAAFDLVKKLMNYIPSNNLELLSNDEISQDLNVVNEELNEIAKDENYDVQDVISKIADKGSFIEFNSEYEKGIITGLCKLYGLTIGVIATNKKVDNGTLNIKNIDKVTKFVRTCDCFNIPILSIVDTKGFKVSLEEEKNGLAYFASKIVYCLSDAVVPKVSLIIGEASGAGYLTLASKETSFDVAYAWPTAKISLMDPEKMVKILYNDEILNDDKPKINEKDIIDGHIEEVIDPLKAAECGCIDDVIVPSETKQRLFAMFDMLQSKRQLKYPKKHGSTLI